MFILDTKLICKYSTEYFEGVIIMGAYATVNQSEYIRNMKKIRRMSVIWCWIVIRTCRMEKDEITKNFFQN